MWAICKKELRQAFSSLTGYIAIVVFLLVNGLVLFVLRDNLLDFGYATLDPFFDFAPWVLLFLVSALTMRSFADEFRSGTYEVLGTRPLSRWQIVTGKFFGAFIVALVALLPTLVYYITINQLAATKGIDAGAAVGSYLGLVLLTALFTAIGICASAFTANAVVAFIASLVAGTLFYFGFTALSELPLFSNGADYYIEMLGINFHYDRLKRGVPDTRELVYFFSLIVFFLWLTRQRIARQNQPRNRRSPLTWLVPVAALVAVNFLASLVHGSVDLTEEKRYSLTPTTKDLLRGLDRNVTVDVFLKGDYPAGFRKLAGSTEEFLGLLKEQNPGRINYRFLSPEDEVVAGKSWGDSLRSAGVEPINLTVQAKAGQENKNIFPYALVHAGEATEVVNLFPSSKRNISAGELASAEAMMEYGFVKSLDKLVNPQIKAIAYAVGNGQPVDNRIFDLQQITAADYRMRPFDLTRFPYVPKEASVLLVVKPQTGFSEAEKLKIDQYLLNGGNVLLFLDNLHAEQDSLAFKSELVAYDRGLNLGDLLFNYGVRVNADLVMDFQSGFQPFAVGGTAQEPQYEFLLWNYYPLFESQNNHPINKSLGLVAGRYVNSIDTVEAEGIRKTVLLQSSSAARTISTPALISPNENRVKPDPALFKRSGIPVAVLLEGRFRSAFQNRIGKAQLDSLAQSGGFKEVGNGQGKLIVVSDGDMVLNDVSNKQGPLPMGMSLFTMGTQYEYQFANREFVLNCLEYLTGKSTVMQTRNKEIVLRLLDPAKTEKERGKWQLINIVLPLALVVLFGAIYQQLRRRRFAS